MKEYAAVETGRGQSPAIVTSKDRHGRSQNTSTYCSRGRQQTIARVIQANRENTKGRSNHKQIKQSEVKHWQGKTLKESSVMLVGAKQDFAMSESVCAAGNVTQ